MQSIEGISKNKISVKSNGCKYPELIIFKRYKMTIAEIIAEILTIIFLKFKCEYKIEAIINRAKK